MSQGRALTTDQRAKFVVILSKTSNVTLAAQTVGFSRRTAYDHRAADAEFAAAWDEALEMATDALEAEARRRALDGCPEPLVSQGKLVRDDEGNPLMVRRYSDTLMALLLKAHRPERFKDRQQLDVTITSLAERLEQGRKRIDGGG